MPRISFGKAKSQKAATVTLRLRGKLLESVERYEAYVESYEGFKPERRLLIEKMLEEFMRSDRDFRRWLKAQQQKTEQAVPRAQDEEVMRDDTRDGGFHNDNEHSYGGETWNR